MNAPVSTAAVGLLCNPKYCIQPRFCNPVPRMKRQRSLTESVRMSVGSTARYPNTLKCWWVNASQQQIMCCTLSASLQDLQVGSPSNRPMVRRCVLTGACLVRIATTILSWCLLRLSRSAALFLRSPLIKSLPCLWVGKLPLLLDVSSDCHALPLFTSCKSFQYTVSWPVTLVGHDGNGISTPTRNKTLVVQPVAWKQCVVFTVL
jgi:hypothetical protein